MLVLDRVDVGWAKLQELRQDLLAFKKSGKPLVAYMRSPGTREYYLATAADKIYMAPEDMLDLKGLRVEASFFKKTLDKIGVQVECSTSADTKMPAICSPRQTLHRKAAKFLTRSWTDYTATYSIRLLRVASAAAMKSAH